MVQLNTFMTVIVILGSIFTGGVAAFFIIRTQLLAVTRTSLKVTMEELDVYKGKVDRLEKDLASLTQNLGVVKTENLALITERDYLRSLIISAITSKKDIHKELIDEIRKSADTTKLFRDGNTNK